MGLLGKIWSSINGSDAAYAARKANLENVAASMGASVASRYYDECIIAFVSGNTQLLFVWNAPQGVGHRLITAREIRGVELFVASHKESSSYSSHSGGHGRHASYGGSSRHSSQRTVVDSVLLEISTDDVVNPVVRIPFSKAEDGREWEKRVIAFRKRGPVPPVAPPPVPPPVLLP